MNNAARKGAQGLVLLRKLLPYTSITLGLALLYVAWTFLSRWNDNSQIRRAVEAKQAKADARIVEMYGSGNLKILSFYSTSRTVQPGEKALVCYGVANATKVRIEPAIGALKPSLSRCVEVSPGRDTTYTLIAEDDAGHTASQSFVLPVHRPQPTPLTSHTQN